MSRTLVCRYQSLDAFRLAQNLAVKVHTAPLRQPHAEQGGAAGAVRRVARAAVHHITAAADRPLPRRQVVWHLVHAQSSCDEARVHLDLLRHTGALAEVHYRSLCDGYQRLSRMLAVLAASAQTRGQVALWLTLTVSTEIPNVL